jgi:hypothetical protein
MSESTASSLDRPVRYWQLRACRNVAKTLGIAFFLLACATVQAQEKPVSPAPKRSTHPRRAGKPWTWLESNMCQADYDAWVNAHQAEISRPA